MSDFEDKTDYLLETKGLLKDRINSLGGSITSGTTFRDYLVWLDSLYEALEEKTITGLPDSLEGNITQTTTNGLNLWNENTQVFTNQSRFSNPTKDSNNVWTFTISGSNGYAFATSNITLQAGTYYASATVNNGDFIILKGGATQTIPFTLTEETEITFRVFKNGNVGDVVKLSNVMLNKGSSPSPYEPYIPNSPSPDYPQPINITTGRQEIDVRGNNNIFVSTPSSAGECLLATGEITTGTNNLRYTTNYIEIPNNVNKLYISGILSEALMNAPAICFYDENQTYISGESYSNRNNFYFNIPSNAKYFRTSYRNVYTDFSIIPTNSYEINLGKNLFNGTLYNGQIGSNGGYTSSTTRITNVQQTLENTLFLPKGTYTLSIADLDYCSVLTKQGSTIIDNFATSWHELPFTFTTTQGAYLYFTGRKSNNSTISPDDYSPQLEKGSQATSYSPYKTPIYLGKIGTYQDYIRKNTGANLFKGYSNMETGFLPQTGSYPTTNSSYPNARYQLIELKEGESLTTSGSTSSQGRIRYIDKTTNQVVGTIWDNTTDYYVSTGDYGSGFDEGTITAKKDFIVGIMVLTENTDYANLMINKGTNTLPYEPYGEGQWYIHKEIGKMLFNGSENWNTTFGTSLFDTNYETAGYPQKKPDSPMAYSNYYTFDSREGGMSTLPNNKFAIQGNYRSILFKNESIANATAFKTWLGTHNTEVYYVLNTPTNTLIEDEELINQLNEIEIFTVISEDFYN